ncbi:MAG: aldo/keto reductase [Actinomycetota bacterium]|nr:MAG: aldo/keto reductase [Actinomycetota bacterium]
MKYVEVSGKKISAIGLGTWQFGSREWGYGREYTEKTAINLVHRALELGVNLIDTAEFYGFGKSETVVGNAISGLRDQVYIATKLFPIFPVSSMVLARAKASAARLQVDSIGLYQLHWPNPLVPIAETSKGLKELLDRGLAADAGVSNFSLNQWRRAEAALGKPIISNQVHFSLLSRGPEAELLPFAQANNRMIIAYSPLEQGVLSGKYNSANRPKGMRSARKLFYPANLDRVRPLLDKMAQIAKGHGATSSQIALAWLIAKPNVAAIPGAATLAQLESNVASAEIELSSAEIEILNEVSNQFDPIGPGALLTDLKTFVRRS